MRNMIIAAALSALLASSASAAPASSYPLARDRFDGTEKMLGTQDGRTVNFTPAQVQRVRHARHERLIRASTKMRRHGRGLAA